MSTSIALGFILGVPFSKICGSFSKQSKTITKYNPDNGCPYEYPVDFYHAKLTNGVSLNASKMFNEFCCLEVIITEEKKYVSEYIESIGLNMSHGEFFDEEEIVGIYYQPLKYSDVCNLYSKVPSQDWVNENRPIVAKIFKDNCFPVGEKDIDLHAVVHVSC